MRTFIERRPSASMVVALAALIAALSGTAVALPGKNTVDSGDIKNAQVTSADVRNNSLRGTDVKNGSLQAKDFKAGELPAGPKGDKGPPGAPGSALAFARINAAGTLDAANSKAVAVVEHPVNGTYCLVVPPGARNIIAQIDAAGLADVLVTGASLNAAKVDERCAVPAANALILVAKAADGTLVNQNVYVILN